jgi:hypothetical protein
MACRPAAAGLTGTWLEMQIHRAHWKPAKSETVELTMAQESVHNKLPSKDGKKHCLRNEKNVQNKRKKKSKFSVLLIHLEI